MYKYAKRGPLGRRIIVGRFQIPDNEQSSKAHIWLVRRQNTMPFGKAPKRTSDKGEAAQTLIPYTHLQYFNGPVS